MTASDLYRDCFWCGYVYDFWREEACKRCASQTETEGPGRLASELNRRPDYNGPDFSEVMIAREVQWLANRKKRWLARQKK